MTGISSRRSGLKKVIIRLMHPIRVIERGRATSVISAATPTSYSVYSTMATRFIPPPHCM